MSQCKKKINSESQHKEHQKKKKALLLDIKFSPSKKNEGREGEFIAYSCLIFDQDNVLFL